MPRDVPNNFDWSRVFEGTVNPTSGPWNCTPEQWKAGQLRAWFDEQPDGGIEALEQLLADAQKQRTRTKPANRERQSTAFFIETLVPYLYEKRAAEAQIASKKVLDKEIRSWVKAEIEKLMRSLRWTDYQISDRHVRRIAAGAGLTAAGVRRSAGRH